MPFLMCLRNQPDYWPSSEPSSELNRLAIRLVASSELIAKSFMPAFALRLNPAIERDPRSGTELTQALPRPRGSSEPIARPPRRFPRWLPDRPYMHFAAYQYCPARLPALGHRLPIHERRSQSGRHRPALRLIPGDARFGRSGRSSLLCRRLDALFDLSCRCRRLEYGRLAPPPASQPTRRRLGCRCSSSMAPLIASHRPTPITSLSAWHSLTR